MTYPKNCVGDYIMLMHAYTPELVAFSLHVLFGEDFKISALNNHCNGDDILESCVLGFVM